MNRVLLLLLWLLPAFPLLAQDENKAVQSPEFRAAREAWIKDRAKGTKTADDWYLQKLKKIKAAAEGRNYALVTAINGEIAALELPRLLVETKWKWTRGSTVKVRFTPEGDVIHPSFKARWGIVPPCTVVLVNERDGSLASLVYLPEEGRFLCRDFDDSKEMKIEAE